MYLSLAIFEECLAPFQPQLKGHPDLIKTKYMGIQLAIPDQAYLPDHLLLEHCGARGFAAPAAGAKRKDNLRFSFLFELLPFPWIVWRRLPTCDRFEKGNGRGFFLPCLSQPVRRIRYITATHVILSKQARHNRAAQFVSTLL